jgi:hypothetical protein
VEVCTDETPCGFHRELGGGACVGLPNTEKTRRIGSRRKSRGLLTHWKSWCARRDSNAGPLAPEGRTSRSPREPTTAQSRRIKDLAPEVSSRLSGTDDKTRRKHGESGLHQTAGFTVSVDHPNAPRRLTPTSSRIAPFPGRRAPCSARRPAAIRFNPSLPRAGRSCPGWPASLCAGALAGSRSPRRTSPSRGRRRRARRTRL